jgi:1-acyl-sn-glycerol-3-phosphate acyltransferase
MPEPTFEQRLHGSPRLRWMQATSRRLCRTLSRLYVTGVENVPATGGVILAINHRSMLDGPLVFGFVPRPVSCLVKAEAFETRMRTILVNAGQIPVVRDTVDPRPVRLCLEIVRNDGVIGVYPEGSRGDGLVRTAKPGVGWFALRSGAPVVPVAVTGTYEMTHRRVRRPVASLTIGQPMYFDRHPDDKPLNRRTVAGVTEQVRSRLADLVAAADARAVELGAISTYQVLEAEASS